MKALVLSSGGIDSTTCLAWAVKRFGKENVIALSIYYGQKHDKELEASKAIADYYGVKRIEEDVSNIMMYAKDVCSLMKGSSLMLQEKSYSEQKKANEKGRVDSYVPFRNGLMLSIATSLADALFNGQQCSVIYGAHADDAKGSAYADCSPEFANAMDRAIEIGTYGDIRVERPLINMTKKEVVKFGKELSVPYELTWSCYEGKELQCGVCGTCREAREAFEANDIYPITYQCEV